MPRHVLGLRPSETGLALLVIGLLAFAAMLVGEVLRRNRLAIVEPLLARVEDAGPGAPTGPEGQVLRVVGVPVAAGPVQDDVLGISAPAITLVRQVDRWAWLQLGEPAREPVGLWILVQPNEAPPEAFPPGLNSTTLLAPGLRVGEVPIGPSVARQINFGTAVDVAEQARAALAARFPERHVAQDGAAIVVAADPARRSGDDLRITLVALNVTWPVTVMGEWRGGQLRPPPPAFRAVSTGDVPPDRMLASGLGEGPGEARFWGRAFGFLVLVCGAVGMFFWPLSRDAQAAGRADPAQALTALDGATGGIAGMVTALPFVIAAAPFGLVLMAAAWACAQGGLALLGGLAAVVALALATLWATAER